MSYHRKRGIGGLFDTGPDIGTINAQRLAQQQQQARTPGSITPGGLPYDPTRPVPGGAPAGPGAGEIFGSFLSALTGKIGSSTMTPAQPVVIQKPSGPSTTTLLAIGGVTLAAILLLTRD